MGSAKTFRGCLSGLGRYTIDGRRGFVAGASRRFAKKIPGALGVGVLLGIGMGVIALVGLLGGGSATVGSYMIEMDPRTALRIALVAAIMGFVAGLLWSLLWEPAEVLRHFTPWGRKRR